VGIFDRIDRFADQLGDLIVPDDVRAHVELGAAYLERGDLEEAAHELECALRVRSDHARARYLLGVVEARRGHDEKALEHLADAARTRPEVPETHLLLGELYRRRGQLLESAAAFRAALGGGLSEASARHVAYRGLGVVYLAEQQVDKAVRELRKAVASAPDEPEAQALLGRALFLQGDLDTARICLVRAVRSQSVEPGAMVTLAELHLAEGDAAAAEEHFTRAVAYPEAEVAARLGLSKLQLARGDLNAARDQLLRALERAPTRPDLLVVLGHVLGAARSEEVALDAYERALASANDTSGVPIDRRAVLEEAIQLALRAEMVARAADYGRLLLKETPDHPVALAVLAIAALAEGEPAQATSLIERSLRAKETTEGRLAAAKVAQYEGRVSDAAASLRRAAALSPNDPRPRDRLSTLYRADESMPRDLYALLSLIHRKFIYTSEWAELSPEVGRLLETLDRPLLVTVMGEFNAGKSTFVNALLGEEIAPMGITPTTATINVLKYGTERRGRVVSFDETVEEVSWIEIPRLLRELSPDQARRIRCVELLFPLETLQRVNVVDTPGLNSIMPEHEEIARRFISESDAVVWLFSVGQAGKATEGEALSRITLQRKKVLGVLNKIDRCQPEEVKQIVDHVMGSLGHAIELMVPVSAKEALFGRQVHDDSRVQGSNYPTLLQTLEERFFSQARAIQRGAARVRLAELLERARRIGVDRLQECQTEAVEDALATLRSVEARFMSDFLAAERRRLFAAAAEVHDSSAKEILEFVRPRRWVFGSHSAAPADRDFLLHLLDERFGAVLEDSRARVGREVERMVDPIRAIEPTVDFNPALRLLDEQVYGRYRAFARGYLRGGRVDDFFTRSLPRIELNEPEIRRALERRTPWSDDIVEAELRRPLHAWAEKFCRDLFDLLEQRRSALAFECFDVEVRLISPLDRFRAALDEMSR
jgi:tetratricopeptide (TPR) repeat protein/GTPase SAR1 family protein